jgi:hypothetical protein
MVNFIGQLKTPPLCQYFFIFLFSGCSTVQGEYFCDPDPKRFPVFGRQQGSGKSLA